MNDTVRTFRAATAEQALAQVRREMGLDAQVIDVKNVATRRLFPWLASRQEFEVKASAASGKRREETQTTTESCTTFPTNTGTIAAAAAKQSSGKARPAVKSAIADVESAASDIKHPDQRKIHADQAPRIQAGVPQISKSNSQFTRIPASPDVAIQFAPSSLPVASVNLTIEQRLDALQQMIADLGRRTAPRGLADIPPELFPQFLTLVEADVNDEIARDLIQKIQRHATPGQLGDTAAATALLTVLIEQQLTCAEFLSPRSGQQQIAVLVGPTGVGKTTTLAKLAGSFSVDHGLKLGLITVDTYRVAAVEQLRTYAQIIDLPMRVVTDVQQIPQAIESLADRDLILIDTAGRSPHDDRQLDELKQLVDAARPDHVYLVLSLTSGARALRNAAERFASARPTSLVFTKLDEAVGCGGLLAASHDIGLPISYLTTGQEVPRDIEPANPCRAARLILGTDQLTNHAPRKNGSAAQTYRS